VSNLLIAKLDQVSHIIRVQHLAPSTPLANPIPTPTAVDVQIGDASANHGRIKVKLSIPVIVPVELYWPVLTQRFSAFVEPSLVGPSGLLWSHNGTALGWPHRVGEVVRSRARSACRAPLSPVPAFLPDNVHIVQVQVWLAVRLF
tara:strand:- start:527 stop:961 length:435 start_codon:yes stop_codon:yes gene_type:complete